MFSRTRSLAALALAAGLGMMVGCSDSPQDVVAPQTSARLMAVEVTPDADAVNVFVDGALFAGGLGFPNNTGYLPVGEGTRVVKVSQVTTPSNVLYGDTLHFDVNSSSTVWATDDSLETIVTPDDLRAPTEGRAHVRFVNFSRAMPAAQVWQTGVPIAGAVPPRDTSYVVFPNVLYRHAALFTAFDAGTDTPTDTTSLRLEVRSVGVDPVIVARVPAIALKRGKIYTVWIGSKMYDDGGAEVSPQVILNN
jgi:hypothetical protein